KPGSTGIADIEENALIGGHRFSFRKPAFRAGDHRFGDEVSHDPRIAGTPGSSTPWLRARRTRRWLKVDLHDWFRSSPPCIIRKMSWRSIRRVVSFCFLLFVLMDLTVPGFCRTDEIPIGGVETSTGQAGFPD